MLRVLLRAPSAAALRRWPPSAAPLASMSEAPPPKRARADPDASRGPPKVLVIAGPTGVGKSALAEQLCRSLAEGGEIISADSVQVYRSLDIGSAKPTAAEQDAIPHHLIDIADPQGSGYTAGQFCRDAAAAIEDVWGRGKVPVVVGGTMMYHQWLVHGQPDAPCSDPAVAAAVAAELAPLQAAADWEGALALLAAVLPERAAKIGTNDWYRLGRALEVVRTSTPPPLCLPHRRVLRAPAGAASLALLI